jgi:hypothetical protein
MLVTGIVQSKSVKLDDIAEEVESASKIESQTMQFRRWLKNERINAQLHYLPFIRQLLHSLAKLPLVLIIDGTTCARGCMTLMVSVVYQGRALPLLWVTRKSKKGHFPEDMHVELIRLVKAIIPSGTEVICLGDGEFDGCQWLLEIKRFGWHFVCRTAKNAVFYEKDERFSIQDICPERGDSIGITGLEFTDARAIKLNAVVYWGKEYKEPLYLVTSFPTAGEAHFWYRKRFKIETLFSDWKGRGFNLQKSGLTEPGRVNRLLIAVALAYIWMIYLGKLAMEKGYNTLIHRTDRCDLSLFRMGRRFFKYFLKQGKPLPAFCLVLSVALEC